MDYELVPKTKTIAIQREGRSSRRFGEKGDVVLKSPSCSAEGELVNLSMDGLLGVFHRDSILPGILENVAVGVRLHNGNKIFRIYGTVIRIQTTKTVADSEYIELAIKFDNLVPEEKHELKRLVHSLAGRARACPYFC